MKNKNFKIGDMVKFVYGPRDIEDENGRFIPAWSEECKRRFNTLPHGVHVGQIVGEEDGYGDTVWSVQIAPFTRSYFEDGELMPL